MEFALSEQLLKLYAFIQSFPFSLTAPRPVLILFMERRMLYLSNPGASGWSLWFQQQ